MTRVVLTIGHAGRPNKAGDRGAAFGGREEVEVTARYVLAMDQELRRLGVECLPLMGGGYAEHWAQANNWGAHAYLNCHVNAGGGDYGAVFYDHRSVKGAALAEAIAAKSRTMLPWPWKALACRPDTNGVPRDGDFAEAFSCISGVQAPAICLEPYFIDGPMREGFVGMLDQTGWAVARGIAAWLGAR